MDTKRQRIWWLVSEARFLNYTLSFLGVRAWLGPSEIDRDHMIQCEVLLLRTQRFLFGFE